VDEPCLDAPYFEGDLLRYFPREMQDNYAGEIKSHRLRRDIVATMITNSIVNRTGFAFAHGLMQSTGLGAGVVAQAYVITRDAFSLRDLWKSIESLDGHVGAAMQSQLFVRVNGFIDHHCRWLLQTISPLGDVTGIMQRYAPGIREIEKNAHQWMSETAHAGFTKTVAELTAQAVPEALATRIAMLEILKSAGDIIDVAALSQRPIAAVGRLYFALGDRVKIGWLRDMAQSMVAENYWQQLAVTSLVNELYSAQRRLSREALAQAGKAGANASAKTKSKSAEVDAAAWIDANAHLLGRYDQFIHELRSQPTPDYPMLIVALRQVQGLVGA
jgi:glutamate dehydrogenase